MKGKQKNCIVCSKPFSSSGHAKCATCRLHKKPRTCLNCPTPVYSQSKRCITCSAKLKIGIKIPVDEFSGFREFITRARRRNKLGDLSLSDVLNQWNKQQGICVYSGVKLVLPHCKKKNNLIYAASLDRIKSELPYTKDNIQFVSASLNYMKGQLTHEETIELCKIIAARWN